MGRFSPGDVVQGLFSEGQWYLATVEQDNNDGTYTVSWFDGDESNRTKPEAELKLMRFDPDTQEYHEAEVEESGEPAAAAPAGEAPAGEAPAGEAAAEGAGAEGAEGEGAQGEGAEGEGEEGLLVEEVTLAVDDDGNPLMDEDGNLIDEEGNLIPLEVDQEQEVSLAVDDDGNPLLDEDGNMCQQVSLAVDDDGNPLLDEDGNMCQVFAAVDEEGNPLVDEDGNLIQIVEPVIETEELVEGEFVEGELVEGELVDGALPEGEAVEEGEPPEPREPAPVGTLTVDDGICLYINLDRREDRKKAMEELAAPHEWLSSKLTRISAVVGDELSWPQLVKDNLFTIEARIMSQRAANMNLATIADDPDECSSHLTLGGCGCALSHRKAWQALMDSDAKWALVLEDDLVHVCQSFDDELKAVLQRLPEDFKICYLGFHTGEPLPEGEHFEGPLVQQEQGWLAGLWCYMISRDGAEMMLEHAVPFQAQVDTVVGILAVGDGRCYTVPPGQFLAFSPPTEESLDTDVQTFRVAPETEEEMQEFMEAIAEEGPPGVQLFSDIALHDAALQGLADVCMQLLEKEDSASDMNARDASGQTALHAAAWAGLNDVCKAILGRSDFTELNAIDDEGNSALHAAAYTGLNDICTQILERSEFTEAGARDCDERTASSLALEKGHAELAETLRKHGA